MPKARILFVDDDRNILAALQRVLRPTRAEWEVACATSGEAALRMLELQPFDIVISDMRMPGMNGSELFSEVAKRYPSVVRIALSGQADEEITVGAIGGAHLSLPKPCDGETLKQAITRACALRGLLVNEARP